MNRKKSIEKQMNEANVYLLLWVDHHDEAYQWAEKKRCVLNHATGSIQVYETQEAAPVEKAPTEVALNASA